MEELPRLTEKTSITHRSSFSYLLPPTTHHLTSPHHQHNRIRARCITNLDCDRDPSFGSARGDAGVDLQNSLHQSRGGSGVKYLSGWVVDKNQHGKKRFRLRQFRSDLAIHARWISLSR